MRRLLPLTLMLLGFSIAPADADKRVALVIGNSSYQHAGRLANPANDADAITVTFKQAGFDVVESRRDLNVNDMRRALRDFSDKARESDVAVIYYAGHGIEVDGNNYVLPVDALLERDADVYDEALALERLLVTIEPAKKLRLIILDACRDNPFAKTMKRVLGTRAVTRGFAKVEPASPNTLVAFAAKAGSTAADGEGRNSPFTAALVRHIATPGLDLRKAFGFVRDEVMQQTSNRQEPFVYGSLGGSDVALVPAPAVAPATPAAGALADVRRDYELAERVGTREAWDLFIATYPSGFYAELAKAQRNKLAAETARLEAADKAHRAGDARERLAAEQQRREEEAKIAVAEKARDEARAKVVEQERAAGQGGPQLAGLTVAPEAAPKESLNKLLQTELRRVGCHTTAVGDDWSPAARRSLEQFNRRAGLKLDPKAASIDALEAVKGKTARVCPLTCSQGFRADGETCVAIVCKVGFEVGSGNRCERIRPKREAKPRRENAQPAAGAAAARAAAAPAPSGQIFCNTSGCRPVAKGCRLVRVDGRGLVGLASGGMAEECN